MHLSFNIARDNGVLVLRFGPGVLGVGDIAAAQQLARKWLDCRTAGVVMDVRKCIVAVGTDGLAAARPRWGSYVSLPFAILVQAGSLDFYRAYSWQAAQEGYMRKAFTCQTAALAWVRARAAVARSA